MAIFPEKISGRGGTLAIPENPIAYLIKQHPFLVSLGLLSTVAVGAAIAYETVPDIRQRVDSVGANIAEWFSQIGKLVGPRPQSIEARFPNKLDGSDFIPVSTAEAASLYSRSQIIDQENYRGFIGFPVDRGTVGESPNLRYSRSFDAILPPYIDRKQLEDMRIRNVFQLTGLPKGAVIYAPVDGSVISIGIAGERVGEGPQAFTPAYTTLRFMFQDREGNDYSVTLSALWSKPLIDIPPYPKGHSPVLRDGAKVGLFQPILELTTDLQDWNGEGTPLPSEKGQVVMKLVHQQQNPRAPIPLDIDFLRETNGEIAAVDSVRR